MMLSKKILVGDGCPVLSQIPVVVRPPSGENPDPELDSFKDPDPEDLNVQFPGRNGGGD
jgi:hypothetical protein